MAALRSRPLPSLYGQGWCGDHTHPTSACSCSGLVYSGEKQEPLHVEGVRSKSARSHRLIHIRRFTDSPTTSALEQHIKTWHLHPILEVNLDNISALFPVRQPRRHNGTSALPRTQTCQEPRIFIVHLVPIYRCCNQHRLRPLRYMRWCCHDLAGLAHLAW